MAIALVRSIRNLDNKCLYFPVEQVKDAMRNLYRQWGTWNGVVHDVLRGKSSFPEEYRKIFDLSISPISMEASSDFRKMAGELELCISPRVQAETEWKDSLAFHLRHGTESKYVLGGVGALGGLAAGAAASLAIVENADVTRRRFLLAGIAGVATSVVSVPLIGAGYVKLTDWAQSLRTRDLEQNAKYLQKAHEILSPY